MILTTKFRQRRHCLPLLSPWAPVLVKQGVWNFTGGVVLQNININIQNDSLHSNATIQKALENSHSHVNGGDHWQKFISMFIVVFEAVVPNAHDELKNSFLLTKNAVGDKGPKKLGRSLPPLISDNARKNTYFSRDPSLLVPLMLLWLQIHTSYDLE